MKTVKEIIEARGGLEALKAQHIHLVNKPWMDLNVERVGSGHRGGVLVAVAHTRIQEGDLMLDPEVVFEVVGEQWEPVTFEQSGVLFQEVVFKDEATGKLMQRTKALQDLRAFCHLWDKNLREQGFIDAAKG
jgi:hypothetical protein